MFKKTSRAGEPKRERKSESRFEATPEWKQLKAAIDRGLKQDESCTLAFSQADWRRIGLCGDTMPGRNVASGSYAVQRFIKKYLAARGRKYQVRVLHSGGFDCVVVRAKNGRHLLH